MLGRSILLAAARTTLGPRFAWSHLPGTLKAQGSTSPLVPEMPTVPPCEPCVGCTRKMPLGHAGRAKGTCGIRAQQCGAGSDPREVGFASCDGTFALRGSQKPSHCSGCSAVTALTPLVLFQTHRRNNASRAVTPVRVWMCVCARMHTSVCMYVINSKEPDSLPAKTGDCFLSLDY